MKVIEGTARADRMPENEPIPPAGEVVRPAYLKYRAAELWDEYAPKLEDMGTLTVVDVPNFGAWCVLMAKFEDHYGTMNASEVAQMRMLAASLGMDASARAKLGTSGKKPKSQDPADEFFKTG